MAETREEVIARRTVERLGKCNFCLNNGACKLCSNCSDCCKCEKPAEFSAEELGIVDAPEVL